MDDTTSAPIRNEDFPASSSAHKIIQEFRYLLEKSQQLFVGLRELSPAGKNWQPHFQRTFEVYTRLWKFQQQHRATLENKEYYDLKRWEIGELASKVGQLYYHYYLRTSETTYLNESFVFYDAIRERAYFRDVLEAKNAPLMVKKLRYYARFIVVCLLLNKGDYVKELMDELVTLVEDYHQQFKPSDYSEWGVVLSEISTFLEAEKKLSPVDSDGTVLSLSSRLSHSLGSKRDGLKLQEAILVGNYQNQVKFSELTLDIYRVLQSLEREPQTHVPVKEDPNSSVAMAGINEENLNRQKARKYLLYRPTFAQLMLYISTCFKDIAENAALLVYVSADGCITKKEGDFYSGGVATAVNYNRNTQKAEKIDVEQSSLIHTLHPADLVPFSRKSLFLVIDSNNSTAFKQFPKVFNQPFACLMSPVEYPSTIKDTTQIGGLFTLFLTCPIRAFAFISDITQINKSVWDELKHKFDIVEEFIASLLAADDTLDGSLKIFLQDDFLASYMVRFVLMGAILNHHTEFKELKNKPTSVPSFPESVLKNNELIGKLKELINGTSIGAIYNFDAEAEGTEPKE